jgi:predicted acetyltransferase
VKKSIILPDKRTVYLRFTKSKDLAGLKELWHLCFNDTERFINWFFGNRFCPEYSVCAEIDGHLIGAMHSLPLSVRIRDRIVSAVMVSGVSTHPDFRSLGLMKNMFHYYLHEIRQYGFLIVTYKPESIKTYASLSHFPITRTLKYEASDSQIASMALNTTCPSFLKGYESGQSAFSLHSLAADDPLSFQDCYSLYSDLSQNYSGFIQRTPDNFLLKISDYHASFAQVLRLYRKNKLHSYCYFFSTSDEVLGEELIAESEESMFLMMGKLHQIAAGRKISLKIQPDFNSLLRIRSSGEYQVALNPQNVAGVTDMPQLIRSLDISQFHNAKDLREMIFLIHDPVFIEHNGLFNLLGERIENRTDLQPIATLQIGSFLQFLFGYQSLTQLCNKSDLNNRSLSEKKIRKADRILPEQLCFAVEEY